MPATLPPLPFDERNDRDFEEMTDRIRQALDLIRKSKSLKPTQNTLANLAKCSRRTLSLRQWPIEELKRIKNQRKPKHTEANEQSVYKTDSARDRESQLVKQIRNYQDQNGQLFERVQYLEEERSRAALVTTTLEEHVSVLKNQVKEFGDRLGMTNLRLVGNQFTQSK